MHFKFQYQSLAVIFIAIFSVTACTEKKKLPIMGERDWTTRTVDGKEVTDTIYHTIPGFTFVNQDGDSVNEKITEGKVYVADFIFTTCPTICPVMSRQMIKVFQAFKGNPDVAILSHTIDPEHDTPAVLKQYAQDLGADGKQWQFLTGPKEAIYGIGEGKYMAVVREDSASAGGFLHSGHFVLVDKEKHVRGMYDGTTEEGTKKLIADIQTLLAEYKD